VNWAIQARFWPLSALLAVLLGWSAIVAPKTAFAQSVGARPSAPAPSSGPVIFGQAIHLIDARANDSVSLILDLSDEAPFRIEALQAPDRLVIDLDRVVFSGAVGRALPRGNNPYALGPVSGYRAGLVMAGQSRIVLDLAAPALFERIDYVRQNGVSRLVVQIKRVEALEFERVAQNDRARRLQERVTQEHLASEQTGDAPQAAPRVNGRPLIVIDPGHGGIDSGAIGIKGEAEKDIVLAFAKALHQEIQAQNFADVAMTRQDDRFISLRERVKFARDRGASLFISLHADNLSDEAGVFGASVYTVSDRASDAAAARAAEKENRVDLQAGIDLGPERKDKVEDILFDLTRRETRVYSHLLARDAVGALRRALRVHKSPLRAAGFRVLQAPDVPSILIELGYLSNADDLAALNAGQNKERLARELSLALARFLSARAQNPP
jgi:N-acetylmuramoyl-L-alanine amidase